MDIRNHFDPGTVLRVDCLLKKTGAKYYSHLRCELLEKKSVDSNILKPSSVFFAVPISYLMMEPKSSAVRADLEARYSEYHLPYQNFKLDKAKLNWLKDKIARFMFITIVDNVIGPSNIDPTKNRPWAVWRYDIETTDPCYSEPYIEE